VRLLDLFCGAGGAAMGYSQAGFTEIVGVDIEPQPNYCGDEFRQGDVTALSRYGLRTIAAVEGFDLIHASPPCQHFTKYRNAVKDITDRYEDLIAPTRRLLEASGVPYVIENVPGAPIRPDLVLCGSMFGLDVRRHRWFELGGWDAMAPGGCNHKGWARRFKPSTGRENLRYTIEVGAWNEELEDQKAAMGVDWPITVRELSEAIPPAYTKFIGEQFIDQVAVQGVNR
jgi:DNA (cytosine-5)-methyltransferase 1